jgi:two-component system, OmpR family, phosphate regulon sensor histidine kinase PhoR
MKKTIFSKIFTGYIITTFLLAVLIFFFSSRIIKTHYIETLSGGMEELGLLFKARITSLLDEGHLKELDVLAKRLDRETGKSITIINSKGVVLVDSRTDPELLENHKNDPEVIQASEGKIGRFLRYSTTFKKEMLYVALPIKEGAEIMGILRVGMSVDEINSLLGDLNARILQILIIIIIASLLIAGLFSGDFAKSIKELVAASRQISLGNFDVKVLQKDTDEIRELADSFNYMNSQIKKLFTELSIQKEELAAIIESIHSGLLVLNKEDKIVLSNEGFRKIAQDNDVEGKFFQEVFKASPISEIVKKVKDKNEGLTQEIELCGKFFLCSCAPFNAGEETAVLLHDITEIRNVERIKRDFIANASHELRTPLTAIKGFVETLEEEMSGKDKYYLEIIKSHTDRLVNIVQSLLLLSELEYIGEKLEFKDINLKDSITGMSGIFGRQLKEKQLKLELELEDISVFKADSFRLEQVFINLIDNAIKYTEKGYIRVSSKKKGEIIEIIVEDTGIGISPDNLPRIFERFYTVDKSHSRKMGGTGLGLSIVKHIVLLHNGRIGVESVPGSGTKFTVVLPFRTS